MHRAHQHGDSADDNAGLIDALAALYAHAYGAPDAAVRRAAEQRALAMRHSDRWVGDGRQTDRPAIDEIRAALVRSYSALLSAVHQP